jgi:F-type H+-transporting ATPase subunit b
MSTETKSNPGGVWLKVAIGLVIMIAGGFIPHPLPIEEALAGMGIPLEIGKTVSALGVLLLLFPVIEFFFVKPLKDAIDERTSSLERTFTEADDLKLQMEKMRSDYERRLQETEANARDQIQAQIKEAQQLRTSLVAEANAKADEMVRRAADEIASERDKVLTELRVSVVNLTLGATEKLLGENMDTEKNRRLVEEFIDKVEVAH